MSDSGKDSDGKWVPPPEIPGSVRHLKRELEDRNKRLVAAYDVIEVVRSEHLPEHCEEDCPSLLALQAYDKAMEKE